MKSDVLNRLWALFKDAGVTIPFAQQDVYIRQWPARRNEAPPQPHQ